MIWSTFKNYTVETHEKSLVPQASVHLEEETTSAVPCVIHYPFSTSIVTDIGKDPAIEVFFTHSIDAAQEATITIL